MKPFISKYKWQGINFLSQKDDREKFNNLKKFKNLKFMSCWCFIK